MFIFASSVCKFLQCLISALTQGGEGDNLFRLTFSLVLWGGRILQTNITGRVWEVLIVYGPHWICPSSRQCALLGSALLRLQGVLLRHCPEWALLFVHFPGLSCSGSQVLCKGTDSVARVFCDLARSEQLKRPGVWQVYCPRWAEHLNHLPGPATRFARCTMRAPSQVCHVSPLGS